ncbi:MAG: bifunctional riboflavin kinase/FAD synthetase [Bacteroidales bacterium OttesenSCG-928-I14]|jgi:riboflavin kinase/FMN adenylyltransferase|nr:bifunctional riboflavin kinase/FAD synthetase [Bacteroidales bacterium OttesenSCG-928-I14]
MKIIRDFSLIETKTSASIGFFDGVHLGHRYLISRLKKYAQKSKLKTAIITFSVHPQKILKKKCHIFLLNTFKEKIKQLSSTGIDYCYIIKFTKTFSETTAKDFVQRTLYKQLQVRELLVGYDNKFGRGRISGYKQYVEYGKICGIKVRQIKKLHEKNIYSSSTAIRKLLLKGKVEEAAHRLTYNYYLNGRVIKGNQLGRIIEFPTANISVLNKEKIIPCEGVYASYIFINNKKYIGMTYIGKRPTICFGQEKRIETNIFNFNKIIYDKKIQIEFILFIRHNIKFDNLQELKKQLEKDKEKIKKLLQCNK